MPPVEDSTIELYELEIGQIQKQLDELYVLRTQNGEMKSDSEGIISSMKIEAGSRTGDGAAFLLTDDEVACQFKCSITKEQGKYVHLGDSLELKLDGRVIEVTADYVTENNGSGYDIICRLPEGTGQPGMGGTISRTVQGDLYETVIPVEAIYQESGISYVYTLNERTGILGNELYVDKLKVRLSDQNEVYAAIEPGILGTDSRIITFCSEELKPGEIVREAQSF